MVISHGGGVGCDDLYAAVRRVVCSLPLLPIVVTNVVGIRLFKLKNTKIAQSYSIHHVHNKTHL